jgi:hypothetical protein
VADGLAQVEHASLLQEEDPGDLVFQARNTIRCREFHFSYNDRRNDKFVSQKIKRSRSTGAPLDLGFDLKGAATDAMKKCASLLGVGLYLSRKPPPRPRLARVGGVGGGGGGMR